MSVEQILADYETFVESVQAKEKEIFELVITTILKENPTLKSIVVKGSTPSFNDGDPCRHWIELMHPSEYESDRESHIETIISNFDDGEEGTAEAIEALIPNIAFADGIISDDVQSLITDISESLYGTDWIIIFHLDDDGKFAFKKADYSGDY